MSGIRRIRNGANMPCNQIVGNAGQRDPRGPAAAYSPAYASDLEPGFAIQRQLARSTASGIDALSAKPHSFQYQPLPVFEAPWYALLNASGVANAVLLVPKNPDRKSLKISNPGQPGGGIGGGNISFSFKAPVPLQPGVGSGIVIQATQLYEERNGVISLDEIYIWSDDPFPTFPIAVVAYEGVFAGN